LSIDLLDSTNETNTFVFHLVSTEFRPICKPKISKTFRQSSTRKNILTELVRSSILSRFNRTIKFLQKQKIKKNKLRPTNDHLLSANVETLVIEQ